MTDAFGADIRRNAAMRISRLEFSAEYRYLPIAS